MMKRRWTVKKSTTKKGKNLAVLIIIVFVSLFFIKNAGTYLKMRSEKSVVEDEIVMYKKENAKLKKKMDNLYEDRGFVEKTARDKLNMVKEGETVYVISEE